MKNSRKSSVFDVVWKEKFDNNSKPRSMTNTPSFASQFCITLLLLATQMTGATCTSTLKLLNPNVENTSALNQLPSNFTNSAQLPKKGLPDECISDIKAQRFGNAQKNMEKLNESDINNIVKTVYDSQAANFDLLLKFAEYYEHIPRKFFLYSALSSQMESNGHNDPFALIKLIKSLKERVIDNNLYSNSTYRTQAEQMLHQVIYDKGNLKKTVLEMLKTEISRGKYGLADKLLNEIGTSVSELSLKEIVDDVVRDLFDEVGGDRLMKYMYNVYYTNKTPYQLVIGLTAVFDNMHRNNSALMTLALGVMGVTSPILTPEYATLPSWLKDEYEKLRNRLPKRVVNIITSSTVLIKNVYRDEYLYADYSSSDSILARTRKVNDTGNELFFSTNRFSSLIDHNLMWSFHTSDFNTFEIRNLPSGAKLKADTRLLRLSNETNEHTVFLSKDEGIPWQVVCHGDHFYIKPDGRYIGNWYLRADADGTNATEKRHAVLNTSTRVPNDSLWEIKSIW